MKHVGLDFDGTLIKLLPSWDDDQDDWVPLPLMRELLQLYPHEDHVFTIITGRAQQSAVGIATFVLNHSYVRVQGVHAQPIWKGYDTMKTWKAAKMVELGIDEYLGDLPADQDAARLAGVPYTDANKLNARLEREANERKRQSLVATASGP